MSYSWPSNGPCCATPACPGRSANVICPQGVATVPPMIEATPVAAMKLHPARLPGLVVGMIQPCGALTACTTLFLCSAAVSPPYSQSMDAKAVKNPSAGAEGKVVEALREGIAEARG